MPFINNSHSSWAAWVVMGLVRKGIDNRLHEVGKKGKRGFSTFVGEI